MMKQEYPWRWGWWAAVGLAVVIMLAGPVLAQDAGKYETLEVFYENDFFGDTDKYYSNALQLTWLSQDLDRYRQDERLPRWTIPAIGHLPLADHADSLHNVGLILGHHIYTPANLKAKRLIKKDRPYAGFLYGGLALHSKTALRLDTLEIVFGVVGPSAMGAEVQNEAHDLLHGDAANGWDHQLKDEPVLRFSWQRKWRPWQGHPIPPWEGDLITNAGLTLGNVKTSANMGGELRLGYNIPTDFGSDLIRPGAGVSAPLPAAQRQNSDRWGLHFFLATQVEAVARNIFLDGNTWKNSHSVDKKPLVANISAGLALTYQTFRFTYRHLFRSEEFNRQKDGQFIGSLTVSYSF